MSRRKLIGVLLPYPEGEYQQKVLTGLFSQCEKYGYELAVFSTMVEISHYHKDYLKGNTNIFNLINYDLFDGIIITPIPLLHNNNYHYLEDVKKIIEEKCDKPVVCIDLPVNDFPTVVTDDTTAFSEITKHVLDVHKCTNIYFLAGTRAFDISEKRLAGFTSELERRGLPIDENKIFYGDFWYSSGAGLAKRIISGELELPDAIICASDHMAIGLTNKLVENGIRVPQDVIITGYDATQEAYLNSLSVTSYIPAVARTAQLAVNKLREIIEPGAQILSADKISLENLVIGETCGCHYSISDFKNQIDKSIYRMNHDYTQGKPFSKSDFGRLMESYMFEQLTSSQTPAECIESIFMQTYLFRPYDHFYLCLRRNWLDTSIKVVEGYPDEMQLVMDAVPVDSEEHYKSGVYPTNDKEHSFPTSVMLPQMFEYRENPSAFFFVPVHFHDNTLGYGVMQCKLSSMSFPTNVLRNWLRNANNALEMSRVQNKLVQLSIKDNMTGLHNRRGMDTKLQEIRDYAKLGDMCFACVIDMDGLKPINDNYGHIEGDNAIIAVADIIIDSLRLNEVGVRAGGDEFYILGVGNYTDIDVARRLKRFLESIEEYNNTSNKPYKISASIGACICPYSEDIRIEDAIKTADENMYNFKVQHKKQRK